MMYFQRKSINAETSNGRQRTLAPPVIVKDGKLFFKILVNCSLLHFRNNLDC